MGVKGGCESNVAELMLGQNKTAFRKINNGDKLELEKTIGDSWCNMDLDSVALSYKHAIVWQYGAIELKFEYTLSVYTHVAKFYASGDMETIEESCAELCE